MSSKNIIFSHIAAVSQNDVIGLKNKLPWNIPEDLKYFYKTTKSKALIMGRKTFESLGSPLPHRLHVVISRNTNVLPKTNTKVDYIFLNNKKAEIKNSNDKKNDRDIYSKVLESAEPVILCSSIPDSMKFCTQSEIVKKYGNEVFITGGSEIYKQTLLLADRLYITRIYKDYEGDAFYPEIPLNRFKEIGRTDRSSEPVPFSFLIYEKKL